MSRPTGDSPPRMRGATASVAGSRGIVPKPTAGQHTYMLLGDGTWGAQPIAGLPSQTSNSGKLLTTDGTNASWTTTGVLTSLTSPASTPLTLGLGTGGTALTLASGTLAATFAGAVTAVGGIYNTNGVIESTLAAGALISSKSTNNNAVHGFQVYGTGTGSRDWRMEQGRNGADTFTITNATGGVTFPLSINGSTNAATFAGDVSAQRLEVVDAAANNRSAAFFRTQNNTTYSSSVLSIQGDRTTTNSTYNLISATNGDLTGVFAVRDSGNAVNTNNSYGSTSDRKLKENIVDATSKLEKLNQVRIVNFNRIGNEQKQLGVIAQELEQIFPSMIEEAIDRDAEGNDLGTTTKSVKYSVFVPMLIKAMQELTARLATLEAKQS